MTFYSPTDGSRDWLRGHLLCLDPHEQLESTGFGSPSQLIAELSSQENAFRDPSHRTPPQENKTGMNELSAGELLLRAYQEDIPLAARIKRVEELEAEWFPPRRNAYERARERTRLMLERRHGLDSTRRSPSLKGPARSRLPPRRRGKEGSNEEEFDYASSQLAAADKSSYSCNDPGSYAGAAVLSSAPVTSHPSPPMLTQAERRTTHPSAEMAGRYPGLARGHAPLMARGRQCGHSANL